MTEVSSKTEIGSGVKTYSEDHRTEADFYMDKISEEVVISEEE